MSEPIVLLEDPSPNGNGVAVVEQDDRVACFYFMTEIGGEKLIRTCWVRNLRPAPEVLDALGMRQGLPPMMPRAHCKHPDGSPPLDPQNLRIVWSEEGDAAALYERDELLAVIPSWSGSSGFDGFSRDCLGNGPIAWELSDTNVSHQRYAKEQSIGALGMMVTSGPAIKTRCSVQCSRHLVHILDTSPSTVETGRQKLLCGSTTTHRQF